MSKVITYPQLVRERVRWNKALKRARYFHGDELLNFAENTAIEYGRWVDEYRKMPVKDALNQTADQLMQLQAIQDVLEQRAQLK